MDATTVEKLREFVEKYGAIEITSTDAKEVNYRGKLYNVDGSKDDPEIAGNNWKALLMSYDIDGPCYVTNETPTGNTHPNFNVGGHMTPNSNGIVEVGGDSYLMPLCKWHNSKGRDGVAFEHTETRMLKLSGFMQGEIPATFVARLPGNNPYSVVYGAADGVVSEKLDKAAADAMLLPDRSVMGSTIGQSQYVLFKRVGQNQFRIVKAQL